MAVTTDLENAVAPAVALRRSRGTVTIQPLEAAAIPGALLNKRTLSAITSLSSATIDRKVRSGDFPKPIKLGSRCTRWRASDVTAWMASKAIG